ncbi:MAG: PTS sugar transporter subunit IIA [Sebaldella sp.]|nr:PTS sugar transporter subunit IIA [Sebaldella sp.]
MGTLINERLIKLDLEAANKDEAIESLANMIHEEKKLNCIWKKDGLDGCQNCNTCSRTGFLDALKERENSFPTAVGFSYAIPHGKCGSVEDAAIAFARLKNEVKWGEDGDEDEYVKYVFMIGVSDKDAGNEHMRILIKLSTSILDDDFREKLSKISTEKEALDIISEYSENLN